MAKLDKLIQQATEHLRPGEVIEAAVFGAYDTKILGEDSTKNGILLATGARVVFYAKRLAGHDLESFPWDKLDSFTANKRMMGHEFEFTTAGSSVRVKWIQKGDVDRFVEIARERVGSTPIEAPRPEAPAVDAGEQLRKIKALHDDGILTAEEYETKRAALLDQL